MNSSIFMLSAALVVILSAPVISRAELPHPLCEAEFDFAAFRDQIIGSKLYSIEEAIANLPLEHRSNVTFVHSTESIQDATLDSPRAILFGNTGRFIVTFNGHNELEGGDALEVLQLKKQKDGIHRFELYEATFDPAGQSPPRFEGPNPTKCTGCHGTDPKVFWGSYDSFKGAYGSSGIFQMETTSSDFKNFKAFAKTAPQHPRYGSLAWNPQRAEWPYTTSQEDSLEHLPNARLTILLSVNTGIALADRLLANPFIKKYPAAFVLSQYCSFKAPLASKFQQALCPESGNCSAPPVLVARVLPRGHDFTEGLYFSDATQEYVFFPWLVRKQLGLDDIDFNISFSGEKVKSTESGLFNTIKELALNRLVQIGHFATARLTGILERDQDYFSGGHINYFKANLELVDYIKSTKTVLRENMYQSKKHCDALTEIAESELEKIPSLQLAETAGLPPFPNEMISEKNKGRYLELISKRCIHCHEAHDSKAPYLPFGNIPKMKAALSSRHLSAEDFIKKLQFRLSQEAFDLKMQMPPAGRPLTRGEKEAMLDYLRAVLNH